MIRGITWTHISTISLESFRSFRGSLFCKPVTGQELFFAVSYSKSALESIQDLNFRFDIQTKAQLWPAITFFVFPTKNIEWGNQNVKSDFSKPEIGKKWTSIFDQSLAQSAQCPIWNSNLELTLIDSTRFPENCKFLLHIQQRKDCQAFESQDELPHNWKKKILSCTTYLFKETFSKFPPS